MPSPSGGFNIAIMSTIIDYALSHWFTILSWIIAIGAFIIVPFRRSAAEARTWLMFFFIAPIGAIVVYLVIGRPEHSKKRQELFKKLPEMMENVIERSGIRDQIAIAELPDNKMPASNLAKALGTLPALSGNKIDLHPDYNKMVDTMIADIDAAKHHVHLEFYIFANDDVGKKVMAALQRADARGVKCRVLIDAMGSITSSRAVAKRLTKDGIEVHRILPLLRRGRSSRIDLRNHRKIAVIDGSIGYTGSQNMVEGKATKTLSHRELMARVEGPVVSELQAVFMSDWYLETEEQIEGDNLFSFAPNPGDISAQVLPSGPDFQSGGVDLFFSEIIHDSRDDVVIVTPYFIPSDALIAALRTAAMRGVNVKLVVSKKSDSLLVKLAQRSYYTILLEAGVDICLYTDDFLHAKHMRIDNDLTVIGSSNMDQRSFELNAEISLVSYGEKAGAMLEGVEQDYFKNCISLDKERWKERPLPVKLAENMARMMSDLL